MSTRTCFELGVCKCKTSICTDYLLADVPDDVTQTEETPTPMEQIAYWGAVAVLAICTLASVLGTAGYLYMRWAA